MSQFNGILDLANKLSPPLLGHLMTGIQEATLITDKTPQKNCINYDKYL